jgi:hypothetical protein
MFLKKIRAVPDYSLKVSKCLVLLNKISLLLKNSCTKVVDLQYIICLPAFL